MAKTGQTALNPVTVIIPQGIIEQSSTSHDASSSDCITSYNGFYGVLDYGKKEFVRSPALTMSEEIRRNPDDAISNRLGRAKILRKSAKKVQSKADKLRLLKEADELICQAKEIQQWAENRNKHRT